MKQALQVGLMAVACQVLAPFHFMKWPALFAKFKVTSVTHHEAEVLTEVKLSKYSSSTYTYDPPLLLPKRTIISYDVAYTKKQQSRGLITLNLEENTVDTISCADVYEPYGGSGELGLFLIGLPGLIVFSPILIINSIIWSLIEKVSGMNRYALNFYLKTKDQLDAETRDQLKETLRGYSNE